MTMDIDISQVPCPVCGGDLEEEDGYVTCQDCDFEEDLYADDEDDD